MAKKENLADMIAVEEKKLARLENSRLEIEGKIKTSKANLAKYRMLYNNYRFSELSNALDTKGIGIEDILDAIQSGDLGSIQNKLSKERSSD